MVQAEEKADRRKEYLRNLYAEQELGDVLEKEINVEERGGLDVRRVKIAF